MVQQGQGGAIVNLGDWADARPYLNYAAYFPSKGAVHTITRTMAVELGSRNLRVRVNCVQPGPVMLPPDLLEAERTAAINATLVKREGSPRNVAQAVVHFIENDFITGACLPVDGGRTIYAIGSNREAARTAGLNVLAFSILPYVISGALSTVAITFSSAQVMSIDPVAGTGLELDAIAAVVIGGSSLYGGRGSILGTLIGVLIMVMIRNGLNLLNVSPFWQGSAIGSVIIAAVLIERLQKVDAIMIGGGIFWVERDGLGVVGQRPFVVLCVLISPTPHSEHLCVLRAKFRLEFDRGFEIGLG